MNRMIKHQNKGRRLLSQNFHDSIANRLRAPRMDDLLPNSMLRVFIQTPFFEFYNM